MVLWAVHNLQWVKNILQSSADKLANLINGGYLFNAEEKLASARASARVMQQMQMHLENNDIKKFEDAQFKLIQYQAFEALQRGGFDVLGREIRGR